MPASALSLRSIVRHHPGAPRPVVDDLSLDVHAGELLALLGPSGAGKSTTLRIVAGYERPDAGRVLLTEPALEPRDITASPPERRGFGMVFQHYALFPHLSVEENVAFGLAARGVSSSERRTLARRALAGVDLEGTGDRAVTALSGGEQQRVALARALVIEPRVLLLDEPLSNLDPTLRITMREELRATLRRSHVTALLVTHDQEDAFAVADRVALLDRGRLLQVGTPESLYDRPASRAVASFIGRATLVPARLDGDGCAVVTIGGVTQRAAVTNGSPSTSSIQADGWLAVLRPESLALASPDDLLVWPGTIVARRFAGDRTVCHVRLGDIEAEVATSDRRVRESEHVGVRIIAESVAVVRQE